MHGCGDLCYTHAISNYGLLICQLNSKLANASQIISESTTLTVGQTIIPAIDVRKYRYFIVAINWMYTPVTMKRYYSSTHDIIETSLTVCDSEIGVLRQVEFLINRSTGEINLKKWNQINLQSNSTWFIPNASGEGVGLYGLF
jgi:hypothetical protein